MSIQEELDKHVNKPEKERLLRENESLDLAIKNFEEVLTLAEEDKMGFFLDIVNKMYAKAESVLLNSETTPSVREQCIGEMRALKGVSNWKKYYLTAIVQCKKEIKQNKDQLETGERPDDQPDL